MKFTGFTLSLALTSMVSSTAIPALRGADVVGEIEGGVQDILAGVAGGLMKRQLHGLGGSDSAALGDSIGKVTHSASMLPVAGVVGTAGSEIAGAGHVKRQLEAVQPVTKGAASSLNGATGIVGSAVGTAESTSQGAVYTFENSVGGVGKSTPSTTLLYRGHTANHTAVAKRQFGNLPATAQQTGTDVIAGLSGSTLS